VQTKKLGFLHMGIRDYTISTDGILYDEWGDVVPMDEQGYVKICPRRVVIRIFRRENS
jgi:hypothetical protein